MASTCQLVAPAVKSDWRVSSVPAGKWSWSKLMEVSRLGEGRAGAPDAILSEASTSQDGTSSEIDLGMPCVAVLLESCVCWMEVGTNASTKFAADSRKSADAEASFIFTWSNKFRDNPSENTVDLLLWIKTEWIVAKLLHDLWLRVTQTLLLECKAITTVGCQLIKRKKLSSTSLRLTFNRF